MTVLASSGESDQGHTPDLRRGASNLAVKKRKQADMTVVLPCSQDWIQSWSPENTTVRASSGKGDQGHAPDLGRAANSGAPASPVTGIGVTRLGTSMRFLDLRNVWTSV